MHCPAFHKQIKLILIHTIRDRHEHGEEVDLVNFGVTSRSGAAAKK
jgi:hypothetical protein